MGAPVDVLAVLDALELQTLQRGGSPSCETIANARSAVASLVIAARHLHIITAGLERNIDANERAAVAAALARVGGTA